MAGINPPPVKFGKIESMMREFYPRHFEAIRDLLGLDPSLEEDSNDTFSREMNQTEYAYGAVLEDSTSNRQTPSTNVHQSHAGPSSERPLNESFSRVMDRSMLPLDEVLRPSTEQQKAPKRSRDRSQAKSGPKSKRFSRIPEADETDD